MPATPRITHTDTSSANAIKTGAPQITHTDTSSANASITAAPQITHTDTSAANAILAAVPRHCNCGVTSQFDTLPRPLQMHSRIRRALRWLRTVGNGWQHGTTFGEHSLAPRPLKWNGNRRYAFGKRAEIAPIIVLSCFITVWYSLF